MAAALADGMMDCIAKCLPAGDNAFGIVVYGFGSYTSYMYPGGLDLEAINPLI